MNSFSEGFVLRKGGSKVHILKAEYEKERPFSAFVLDLVFDKRPFEDDLSERLWAVDIGISKLVIYVGVMLFSALSVKMSLL